jgi:hypothetical protein
LVLTTTKSPFCIISVGVSATGTRFDGEVLGLYRLRDYKMARAQIFYFDEAAACSFLAAASRSVDR